MFLQQLARFVTFSQIIQMEQMQFVFIVHAIFKWNSP